MCYLSKNINNKNGSFSLHFIFTYLYALILFQHSGAVQVIEVDCVLNADTFSHAQKITF